MKVQTKRIPITHNGKTYKVNVPFEVSESDYEKIKGLVEVIEEDQKTINEMLLDELIEYAAKNNIDLGEATLKDDIKAVIKSHLEGVGNGN
ncbi:hypothetical protein VQL36_19355 [Chengkuizengella sp. SCS-71B]|uniref:hypothetical protein n=1 Tax=Chengkuizengella sp. SCS-71B TaxID=3115290 RepID=UPI0032C226CA